MKKINRRATWLVVVPALLLITITSAGAYIDPGTGSYILQIAAATVLAGLLAIKCFWRSISQGIVRIVVRRRK